MRYFLCKASKKRTKLLNKLYLYDTDFISKLERVFSSYSELKEAYLNKEIRKISQHRKAKFPLYVFKRNNENDFLYLFEEDEIDEINIDKNQIDKLFN